MIEILRTAIGRFFHIHSRGANYKCIECGKIMFHRHLFFKDGDGCVCDICGKRVAHSWKEVDRGEPESGGARYISGAYYEVYTVTVDYECKRCLASKTETESYNG